MSSPYLAISARADHESAEMWVGCSSSDAATRSPCGVKTAEEKSWPSMIIREYAVRMMMVRISRTIEESLAWTSSAVMGSTGVESTEARSALRACMLTVSDECTADRMPQGFA